MGERSDLIESKKTCHPFDGVKGSKHSVEGFFICRICFEGEQMHVRGFQVFPRLGHEVVQEARVAVKGTRSGLARLGLRGGRLIAQGMIFLVQFSSSLCGGGFLTGLSPGR